MLTPVDIENKEFTKAFRGYDIYEVEEFMKTLVADYEKLYRDNAELKEKNAMLNEAIGSYKGMEETMQNAIMVAQRTAEDIKKNAYERSETIVKDAERRAAEAINNANRSISNLEKSYLSMQREMNGFKAKMSALLSTYMQLLSDLPEKPVSTPAVNMSIPEPVAESSFQPKAEAPVAEPDKEDTNTFTLPSKEAESAPCEAAEALEQPAVEPTPAKADFTIERKVNPVVEELLQKNREERVQETGFSVTKETIEKEAPISINVEDLKTFDVFSDDSI